MPKKAPLMPPQIIFRGRRVTLAYNDDGKVIGHIVQLADRTCTWTCYTKPITVQDLMKPGANPITHWSHKVGNMGQARWAIKHAAEFNTPNKETTDNG